MKLSICLPIIHMLVFFFTQTPAMAAERFHELMSAFSSAPQTIAKDPKLLAIIESYQPDQFNDKEFEFKFKVLTASLKIAEAERRRLIAVADEIIRNQEGAIRLNSIEIQELIDANQQIRDNCERLRHQLEDLLRSRSPGQTPVPLIAPPSPPIFQND